MEKTCNINPCPVTVQIIEELNKLFYIIDAIDEHLFGLQVEKNRLSDTEPQSAKVSQAPTSNECDFALARLKYALDRIKLLDTLLSSIKEKVAVI